MKKKILLFTIVLIVLLLISVYFWVRKTIVLTPPSEITTPISTQEITKIKNPAVSNSVNDLTGRNFLEGIGLVWDRDNHAVEYVIFRSDSIGGPFAEIGRVPAGVNRRTNATDLTPDAQLKTLCYKVEVRDAMGEIIRIYEPVCVPKWQK